MPGLGSGRPRYTLCEPVADLHDVFARMRAGPDARQEGPVLGRSQKAALIRPAPSTSRYGWRVRRQSSRRLNQPQFSGAHASVLG